MFNRYLRDSSYSSTECLLQKGLFLNSLKNGTEWAVSMLDASGRLPQAITQGNVYDLGMYDQCLNMYVETNNITIKGKYCSGGLAVPLADLIQMESNKATTILLISTCLPDACLPSDFFGKNGKDDNCKIKNQNKALNGGDIAFLIFLSVVLLAMVASTAYDIHMQKYLKGLPRHNRYTRCSLHIWHKTLLAFSVYTNGKKIIRTSKQSGQIRFFNGMKVISMFWVILGHRFESYRLVVVNQAEIKEWQTRWYASYVLLFRVAVDTFFFVSAALMSYSFLKSHRNSNNVLSFYVHRYFRLTPALAALYFLQVTLARRIASGPYIPQHTVTDMLGAPCIENWWSFFLYIQNYVSPDNMCMVHTWYVDVDMQFTLISPLVLIPLLRYPKQMTYIVLPILILITTIHPMLITYLFKITLYSINFKRMYYKAAHMRISEWLVGIMFGAFLVDYEENKDNYRIKSKVLHLLAWLFIFVTFVVQLLLENKIRQNRTVLNTMLYYPLQRTIWPLCLCWISYACLSGYASLVNWFLSLSIFQVLSKIIYSTYLVHEVSMAIHADNSRTLHYFSHYELMRIVIVDIVMALIVGAFWALAFEYPGIKIEEVFFNRTATSRKTEKTVLGREISIAWDENFTMKSLKLQ